MAAPAAKPTTRSSCKEAKTLLMETTAGLIVIASCSHHYRQEVLVIVFFVELKKPLEICFAVEKLV